MGLWATVQSCEMELAGQGFNYNYIIVQNGTYSKYTPFGQKEEGLYPLLDVDALAVIVHIEKLGKLKQHLIHPKNLAPPTARQYGTIFADGKYLFFFDNHCLVDRDYFRRAIADFEHYPIDCLHSTTKYYEGGPINYEYILKLDKNFWGESAPYPKHDLKPYQIGVGGHGGFAIRREVWEAVGGYWDGFIGYGGEETYFDLKLWQLGYSVWIDPRMIHYHYAGQRGYNRHYTDEFFINMMAVANIIGGQGWMDRVCKSFTTNYPKMKTGQSIFDLSMIAQARSQAHADELAAKRKKSLDELLQFFREQQIAH